MSTLLLIDDDELVRRLLRKTLELRGHRVWTAANAGAGLLLAQANRPDLILLDLQMSGVSGWDAVVLLRGSRDTASIPIVAFTSIDLDTSTRARLEAVGFDRSLPKALPLDELVREIEGLVGGEPV